MQIEIQPIEKNSLGRIKYYRLSIPLNGDTEISKTLNESELKNLLNKISIICGYQDILEKFGCQFSDAEKITKFWESTKQCNVCELKMIECYRCVMICESPLERGLFLELIKNGYEPELQMRISKENEITHYPEPINTNSLLTIPDFFLKKNNKKICIYTDGHTYHERTEYQAIRDRNIDRELQNYGYVVLRYTGKEIREQIDNVIKNITKVISDNVIHPLTSQNKEQNGYCIRTGVEIPFNIKKPLSLDSYKKWIEFGNPDTPEKFCHFSGEPSNGGTSVSKPILKKNLEKAKEIFDL